MNFQNDLNYFGLNLEQINQNPEILKFLYREKAKQHHPDNYLTSDVSLQEKNMAEFQKLNDSYTNLSKEYYVRLSQENKNLTQEEINDLLKDMDFENFFLNEQLFYYENMDLITSLNTQMKSLKQQYKINSKSKAVPDVFLFNDWENKKRLSKEVYVNMLLDLDEDGYDLALHLMIFMEQKYDDFSLEVVLKEFANAEVKKKNSGIQR